MAESQSRLYEYFRLRWLAGTVTIEKLEEAVVKGYITKDEFDTIIAQ